MRNTIWLIIATTLMADPIPTAIMHPARLMFYAIYPDSPTARSQITIAISETNDYEKEPIYYLDYELTTLTIIEEISTNEHDSLRAILPVYRIWGGVMDRPLDAFHDLTGTLHGYRHNEDGENRVHILYANISKTASYSTIGNIQIEYKYTYTRWNIDQAFKVGLKLPTASTSTGFGSGHPDWMIGWIGQKGAWTLELDIVRLGSFSSKLMESTDLLGALTLTWSHGPWSVDYRFRTSPFKSAHFQLDSTSNTLNIAYSKSGFTFFISENLAPFYNSPDLTLGIGYRF